MDWKGKYLGKRGRRRIGIVLIILALLVSIRLLLPFIVLRVINNKMADMDGYTGHVEDIDLLIIAGSYSIKNIEIMKTGGKIPVPFFAARKIDLSLEWRALFKGSIVGEIEVDQPTLNFVQGPTKATTQTTPPKDWEQKVDELMPLKINRLAVNHGQIHYRDFHSKPKVDVELSDVNIEATNLTNANDNHQILPATANATANLYEGRVRVGLRMNPLDPIPTFDVNAELKDLNMVALNEFLKAYANFDVRNGRATIVTEAAAKEGKIKGYIKPIIKDIDVKQGNGDIGQVVWKAIVGASAWLFKNHPKDQLATQIEFEGNLQKPGTSIISILGETLRNAFIQAIQPSLENSVSIANVANDKEKKGFLKGLFDKKKK